MAACSSKEDGKMVTARRPSSGHPPNSRDSISVAVVGYIRFYRESLVQSLSRNRRLVVADLLAGGQDSLERIAHLHPDVILVHLPATSAVKAIREITNSSLSSSVIALAPEDDDAAILAMVEVGLSGFVPREGSLDDVNATIEDAMRGELPIPPRIAAALVARLRSLAAGQSSPAPGPQLTARESEIVGLLEQGLTNKEIAARLGIEPGTVKGHVHHLLGKTGVQRRSEVRERHRDRAKRLTLIDGDRNAGE
jgi:DNA-binding NarL/FixJ family response regulator